jgi:hypothetical protein
MVDGICLSNFLSYLLENSSYWISPVCIESGEIIISKSRNGKERVIKQFKHQGLHFSKYEYIKPEKIFMNMNGSMHVYKNMGRHNCDEMTINDVIQVLLKLNTEFGINPYTTAPTRIEFGVNIHTDQEPYNVFDSIIMHGTKVFVPFEEDFSKGITCTKNDYEIKIYAKGLPQSQNRKLIRFEIAIKNMRYLNKQNIKISSLADLCKTDTFLKVKNLLLSHFDKCFIVDLKLPSYSNQFNSTISLGCTRDYWRRLLPNTKDFLNGANDKEYQKQRRKYYATQAEFIKIHEKYSKSGQKNYLHRQIADKCDDLCIESSSTSILLAKLDKLKNKFKEDSIVSMHKHDISLPSTNKFKLKENNGLNNQYKFTEANSTESTESHVPSQEERQSFQEIFDEFLQRLKHK